MKNTRTLRKATVAITAIAFLVFGLAGCDLIGGGDQDNDNGRYEVRFDNNGGTGFANNGSPANVEAGQSLILPGQGAMYKPDHVFGGWMTSPQAGTVMLQGTSYTPTSNVTLYAKWIPEADIEPIDITITGIDFTGDVNMIVLNNAGGGSIQINDIPQYITVTDGKIALTGLKFLTGNYRILLRSGSGADFAEWISTALTINAGTNDFVFTTSFTKTKHTSVTVTSITVTDVDVVDIEVMRDKKSIAIATGDVKDGTAVLNLLDYELRNGQAFTEGGTVELKLTVGKKVNNWTTEKLGYYHLARNLDAGKENTIPFGEFTEMPPLNITVTGIPSGYSFGSLRLFYEGGSGGSVESALNIPDTTFPFKGVLSGTYGLNLQLYVAEGDYAGRTEWTMSEKAVTENTTVAFSDFRKAGE